eukprot:Seg5203.3 transcript_id=Seg5203.3/GoldUCD/mRNA.D3Y31 product="AP-5 complex subunit sigma-1" protein_id=Seg5203.3/GoldUCD/D3Y31
MVYAFIVQSLANKDADDKIVYSEVFGAGLNQDVPVDDQRKVRKQQLQQIAARVNSEFRFKKACTFENQDEVQGADRLVQFKETGVFRLPIGKPLPVEKHVIWQALETLCFTFILAPEENKALAENVLSLIVQLLLQTFRSIDQSEEMLRSPDKVATVLHIFLPNGQLIFMNHRVVKQLEKELYQVLNEAK